MDDNDVLATKVRKRIIDHCRYLVASTGTGTILSNVLIVIADFDHAFGFYLALLYADGP
ncbi:hypothetical protein [Paraburkholderia elongata]|uniref:Uncharacterized protein n=1 Tax=Paraburkholderia elongata TaxID=2675747 RepID=A0A972NNI9_9BURK|nr:hypothetical protein [Paraburkholderia elongata]NPT56831.1 hypothetical protein [Paraburkholderia elongata]